MVLSAMLFALLCMYPSGSFSQDDQGGNPSELKTAVWTMQAEALAREMGLDSGKKDQLTEAYLGLRDEISIQGKEKLQGLEGEAREQESDLITSKCVGAFNGKLATFLEPKEADRASFILGSLNNRWEQYLRHLFEFGLNEEKMDTASQAVCEYVEDYLSERKKASDANTRFSGEIATQLKAELDAKIVTLLSEEQYAEWSRSTARKPRGN
jgi:hypothetical protein